jgi:long-subunit fatty acid transport protein
VVVPQRIGLGVSYTKVNKFTVGFDYMNQDWRKFKSFDRSSQSVQNAHFLAVGAQFIPDINSVENYLKRITYRVGFEYDRTPYRVKDEPIDEFGINFGVSLPVSGFSNLNFGFEYGQIGATRNGLIKEEYFKFTVGASFNSNRWKRLPRFN